nr:MAG TPA: hypothetical protein [Caudoviricetes sp.]
MVFEGNQCWGVAGDCRGDGEVVGRVERRC